MTRTTPAARRVPVRATPAARLGRAAWASGKADGTRRVGDERPPGRSRAHGPPAGNRVRRETRLRQETQDASGSAQRGGVQDHPAASARVMHPKVTDAYVDHVLRARPGL